MVNQKSFLENFKLQAQQIKSSLPAKEKILQDINRLNQLAPDTAQSAYLTQHIQFALSLPWGKFAAPPKSLYTVSKMLNQDVYGLERIKEEILHHVSVLNLTESFSNNICFTGPPGVGKSLFANTIARALGRPLIRIPVAAISQVSDLFGQSKIFMSSEPGKMIQSIVQAGIMNPVVLLDGIDKISQQQRAPLTAAFSELLDKSVPFFDKYLELKFDISKIVFILTANLESAIPYSIRQKIECYRISGYYHFEKVKIGSKYILPEVRKKCGLKASDLKISESDLEKMIHHYTQESGVLQLEKHLMQIGRKRATQVLGSKKPAAKLLFSEMAKTLGAPIHRKIEFKKRPVGVCKGLAWTNIGGQILDIECKVLPGKGRIHLTGKMGDVMKESALIALTLVKERCSNYNLDSNILRQSDIHIHIPEAAFPKDGPSAGLALVISLFSALLNKPVPPKYAFTGEITLSGKLLGVGGIPEKFIAAYNLDLAEFVLPKDNFSDCQNLSELAQKKLPLKFIQSVDDILKTLFSPS